MGVRGENNEQITLTKINTWLKDVKIENQLDIAKWYFYPFFHFAKFKIQGPRRKIIPVSDFLIFFSYFKLLYFKWQVFLRLGRHIKFCSIRDSSRISLLDSQAWSFSKLYHPSPTQQQFQTTVLDPVHFRLAILKSVFQLLNFGSELCF